MISKYGIFCKVVESGSFTRVAEQLGYSQSAVSQTVKTLEQELGTVLIDRRRDGMVLTSDGRDYYAYFQAIVGAENALDKKHMEMQGLENSTIRIGSFTSVSRNLLPQLMKDFKKIYPGTKFVLQQSGYTGIARWVLDGTVDFGFTNPDIITNLDGKVLWRDDMMAILPPEHRLSAQNEVSLQQLAEESFILLDEGDYSVCMNAFKACNLMPHVEYEVYDDFSILEMVRQGLGVSAMYRMAIGGFEGGLKALPIREKPERTIALVWRNWDTMSFAARRFAEFLMEHAGAMMDRLHT